MIIRRTATDAAAAAWPVHAPAGTAGYGRVGCGPSTSNHAWPRVARARCLSLSISISIPISIYYLPSSVYLSVSTVVTLDEMADLARDYCGLIQLYKPTENDGER